MRVTSNHYHTIMTNVTQRANAQLADVMLRMATGERILRTSDDPIGSVRLAVLFQQDAKRTQYRDNIGALDIRLQASERMMANISEQLATTHDLMLWAADGGKAPQDLDAIVQSLASIRKSLLQSVNSRDSEGNYLFSGTAIATAPIEFDPSAALGSRYTFAGNEEQQHVVVGEGVTEVSNDSLREMEGILNKLDLAIEKMSEPGADPNDAALRNVLVQAMDSIDSGREAVDSRITRSGNARKTLEMFDGMHEALQVVAGEAALDVGQVDQTEVYSEFMSYQTALVATQKVYAQVTQLTLFNIL
ncbi:flagellar biosynthesis protein FlgL [Burkholderia diffusa]|uniref:Flagellar biosynthesis protein FlgL n=1 Tax=Burkholderia diffusa TaxID=488732 RepID=A0AAW3P7I2_9BURK|nr:flagellar biosynthesis protein FlgL [Burkholderia diffusa]KVH43268.1 flagellar biosynthesis protein FlgL [Burkholderia diffusa]KVN02989.1 flagellar biosynthesis protein FlgL [Burkholderia diffusa]KWF41389.1 flagellar biosynthesis protein FlgL [Burkholderia diffusa]KWF44215.1 flagellar biosynthesis protein FlgL [Burkholderia diffusa]KWF45123.1 flagellar biosynthesis protein FlgL [Burkholderia diffusa]